MKSSMAELDLLENHACLLDSTKVLQYIYSQEKSLKFEEILLGNLNGITQRASLSLISRVEEKNVSF
jgi:hypothetical protein